MKLSCRECGAKLDVEELEKLKDNICPICKKSTSWFTEPEFWINPDFKP